jgi:sugar/nucleoside kinase (ribokinase family)
MRTLLLGEALVDLVCERPVAAFAEADAFVPHPGGSVANVAVTAARAGAQVALAGGAGDDPWGAWLLRRLEAERVGLDWFRLVGGTQTPLAFVTVDAAAQPTYAFAGGSLGLGVEGLGGPLLREAVGACDALYFSSNTMVGDTERQLTLGARDRALDLGRPIVFDANLRTSRWPSPAQAASVAREAVAGALLVKANAEEARLLTGERRPEAAAAGLIAAGAQHALVTMGADGALLRGGGLRIDVPGVPARAVDATGAGDALAGIVLARLTLSDFYPPAIAAALPDAVAHAARTTERWGAVGA